LNQLSEKNIHSNDFNLNELIRQIYQRPLKLSAKKDAKGCLKALSVDNHIDMFSVYLKNLAQLQLYAYSFLNNLSEAEDVTASVIEKFIQIKDDDNTGFNSLSESELLGYLKVSIRNLCIDLLRKRKVKQSFINFIGDSFKLWRTPDVYDKFQLEAFELLLLELSPREREILEQHIRGLKNDEISQKLGLSSLTVRNTLHNAKKRVRKLWNIFMR
jgi:RNA polymerase sigma factor (sigma-70 family)